MLNLIYHQEFNHQIKMRILLSLNLILLFTAELSAQIQKEYPFEILGNKKVTFSYNSDNELIDNPNNATYYREIIAVKKKFEVKETYRKSGEVRMKVNAVAVWHNMLVTDEEFVKYSENGRVLFKRRYNDKTNKLEEVEYFPNGKKKLYREYRTQSQIVKFKIDFKTGLIKNKHVPTLLFLDGKVEEYYETGKLKNKGSYKLGEKDGEWIFYEKTGEILEVQDYSNGNLISKIGHPESKVYVEYTYKDNTCIKHESKTKAGEVIFEMNYLEGKKNGKSKEFYPSGSIKGEGEYKEGKKEGKWISYFEDGKIKEILNFKKNLRDGSFKSFNASGNISSEGEYVSGSKYGEWKIYFLDKGILRTELYKDYILIKAEEKNKKGDLKKREEYKEGVLSLTKEYENGMISSYSYTKIAPAVPKGSESFEEALKKNLQLPKNNWTNDRMIIQLEIDSLGNLINTTVLETCNDVLDSLVEETVKKFEFNAAIKDRLPIAVKQDYVINLTNGTLNVREGNAYDIKTSEEIFSDYDLEPRFKNGVNNIFDFIANNFRIFNHEAYLHEKGVVFVKFNVLPSGLISNVETIDNENSNKVTYLPKIGLINTIKKMPNWVPGKKGNEFVTIKYYLSLNFK